MLASCQALLHGNIMPGTRLGVCLCKIIIMVRNL